MKNHIIAAALAAACAFQFNPAQADTVYIDYTFDLSRPTYQEEDLLSFDGARIATQQIQVGDVVEMRYHFQAGQSIRMTAGSGGQILWTGIESDLSSDKPNTSNFTISNLSFDLIGAGSNFQTPPVGEIHSSGSSHIGSYYFGDYIPVGQSVSFSGFRSRFTVLALEDNAHYYNRPFFLLASLGGQVSVQAVPEPETYAMLLAGVTLLACARRRQRQTSNRA